MNKEKILEALRTLNHALNECGDNDYIEVMISNQSRTDKYDTVLTLNKATIFNEVKFGEQEITKMRVAT